MFAQMRCSDKERRTCQSELQRLRAAALESEAQVQTERESWKSNNLALSLRVDELSRYLVCCLAWL